MQKFYQAVATLVFTLSTFTEGQPSGKLRFAAENIDVALYPPDTVEVTGEYFFTSSDGTACEQRLIYPFPTDSAAEFPCFIAVRRSDDPQKVPFNRIENGISFWIGITNEDTVAVTVTYRQRFGNKTGRYILTTTAYWSRPLTNSRYSIRVPVNTTLDYLSYECDTIYTSGKDRIYTFFKRKFVPDRDLVFMWQ